MNFSIQNEATLCGTLFSEPWLHHITNDNTYYSFLLKVERQSGTVDLIHCLIPEQLLFDVSIGDRISITGRLYSHKETTFKMSTEYIYSDILSDYLRKNPDIISPEVLNNSNLVNGFTEENNKRRLNIYCFVNSLKLSALESTNIVLFDGYVKNEPIFRFTPLNRKICDLILNVSKYSTVPCITWGNSADFASYLNINEHVMIKGRLQSRFYLKECNGNFSINLVHEVSTSYIKVI